MASEIGMVRSGQVKSFWVCVDNSLKKRYVLIKWLLAYAISQSYI